MRAFEILHHILVLSQELNLYDLLRRCQIELSAKPI